ncbi:MAG: nicotinamide riboside transporter PnuC [Bacteroidetes bacterium]|nr:nicotinamide riboside transporter PnuC [Bacteroidota bacterium]
MIILSIFDTFWANLLDTSWLEFLAVVFGLLSVWYARQENILVYPTGIVSVLIYVYICFGIQLYADAGINLFYFLMSVYGWIKWTRKSSAPPLKITACTKRNWYFSIGLFLISAIVILVLLKIFKANDLDYWSTNIPYIDTFTTAIFIVGMWLMAIKKVENWIFWIIGDVISVPLYAYKGLVFTSFQFMVFLIIAVMGYISWKEKLKQREEKLTEYQA